MRTTNHPGKPFIVSYTVRATKCGAPAIKWQAHVWRVAGKIEVDLYKNGHVQIEGINPTDILATIITCGGARKREMAIANKFASFCLTVRSITA